jgi:PAS domain-containing protein
MISEKLSLWFSRRTQWVFSVAIGVLAIAFIISMSSMNIAQNVESRALSELQSTVGMQASAFTDHMSGQFQALQLVANMLANGRYFVSEELQPTLTSVVDTFRLCTLCLADTDGNTTDYLGNILGSCSDREYFREIIDGSHTQICEYLAATKLTSEPRVILSIPAYDENGEMLGVLFCSKEISILEDSIFAHNNLFDTTSGIFICDNSGNVIAANENGYGYFEKESITGDVTLNINDLSDSMQQVYETGNAQEIKINGDYFFAAYTAVDDCGWGLYCLVSEANATENYRDNQKRIENTVTAVMLVFALALAYIILLGKLYLRRKSKEALSARRNFENYKHILKEARCAIVEYDLKKVTLTVIESGADELKLNLLNGSLSAYEKFKQIHPEYDFDELKTELDLAKVDGKTYSFESLLNSDGRTLCWLRTTIIPITDEDGTVETVLFAVFDVSDAHLESDAIYELYENVPAGVHRCYLQNPIHVEYISDGFCKMLGYTHEEIDKIIGPEKKYSLLISEEDRPTFSAFVRNLSIHGGTETCEYRMVCADGSLLAVSDTMDAKQSSSGIMYGYSIVTDRCTFVQMQQELSDVKHQLEQSRIKNANSQMQPHFLYNALSSIREIVLEDPEYASDLIYDFTTHLRACIRSMSGDSMVSFAQELENIKAYVNIEKMRFGDRLRVMYDCQETGFDIVPLSIQPLVENAIRHGIYERGAVGGAVTVSSARSDNCFVVCIEDDGVGFDFDAVMAEVRSGKRDSNGLYNLIFRFEKLMNAQVVVESKMGTGTKITISIPSGGKQ